MTDNIVELENNLEKLIADSDTSDVEITTLGIRIYLMRKKQKINCLIVPNNPLDDISSEKMKEIGFNEIFEKINYEKVFQIHEISNIVETISNALSSILLVPIDRVWRIQYNKNVVHYNPTEPILPNSIRRESEIKKNNSFFRVFFRLVNTDLGFSIIGGILLGFIINLKYSKEIKDLILPVLIFTVASFILLKLKNFIREKIKN